MSDPSWLKIEIIVSATPAHIRHNSQTWLGLAWEINWPSLTSSFIASILFRGQPKTNEKSHHIKKSSTKWVFSNYFRVKWPTLLMRSEEAVADLQWEQLHTTNCLAGWRRVRNSSSRSFLEIYLGTRIVLLKSHLLKNVQSTLCSHRLELCCIFHSTDFSGMGPMEKKRRLEAAQADRLPLQLNETFLGIILLILFSLWNSHNIT